MPYCDLVIGQEGVILNLNCILQTKSHYLLMLVKIKTNSTTQLFELRCILEKVSKSFLTNHSQMTHLAVVAATDRVHYIFKLFM